ncbi:MAG TPA: glycoside hydrolase family 2 TIM barrel-domain containing protein, partial [Verrucomicrobiae bacterium]|nr:glycoside hydrolase family 2 TIM barrel-domain containing protein [Verrucomicrobiae bacterium]
VWVDERLIGTNNALATPHEYDLGPLAPGKHTCTIRVDNRMVVDIGENSHSISDHTQGNWNGVVGRIELRATPRVWIDDLQIYPELARKRVRLKIAAGNASGGPVEVELVSKLAGRHLPNSPPFAEQRTAAKLAPGLSTMEITYLLGERAQSCFLWDEFSPRLYSFQVRLRTLAEPRVGDDRSALVGFREISAPGSQFLINNRKTFFRGTLDCCVYPKTGHPPTDVESWKRVIRVCKAHGLNLVRFHSWCPPEAAFVAADELGFYFHVEASAWANQSTTLGDGKPVDNWVYAETDGILKYYGNHPSFILMAYGNEPGGKNYAAYLTKYVDYYKSLDPRRLWTSASGWPELPGNQFHVTPDPRIQGWGEGLKSRINGKPPETITDYRNYVARRSVPVISHEIGQWCVFPNFEEIKKYTGYLKPKNFEIFRDSLNAHHLGGLAHQFLLASGKLQALCYKEEIESALRTPGMGGFELLDLHDFPGQGTALVGVLDPFWESKGYITPKEYTRFCNSVVPLARLAKRLFTTDEMLDADLEIANFSPGPLAQAQIVWELADGAGKVRARGGLPVKTLPVGNGISLGRVSAPLASLDTPAKYKLIVSVKAEGSASRRLENDWDLWVYPPNVDLSVPADITLTDDLDQDALDKLNAGGKVLLNIPPKRVRNDGQEPVKLGFSSIFWNTAWTSRQAPTTLGVLCDPKHPVFAQFPTEYHSNWQWWYLISHASAMILDDLP